MTEIATHDPRLVNADLAPVAPERRTPLFTALYDWAWFVGSLVAAVVYVLGMRLPETRERGAGSGS